MKRILAMLLTVAMIATACPMAFADEVTEESNITVTENLSAEALEKEENIEETAEDPTAEDPTAEDPTAENEAENEATIQVGNISLFAAGNEISLMSADEVQYSTNGSTWTSSSLTDAVSAIGTGTGTIKVMQDITLTEGIAIKGNITIDAGGQNVTIKRGFATGTETSYSAVGDSMFSVFNGASGPNANLTLGSADNTYTLTIDGNKSAHGETNKGSIIYSSGASSKPASITLNKNVILQNNKTSKEGGAIYSYSYANISINGASLLNNETTCSSGGGGAVYVNNNNPYTSSIQYNISVNGAEFIGNKAAKNGGAICIDGKGSTVSVTNSSFTENSAQIGSAIAVQSIAYTSDRTTSNGLENAFVIDGCSFVNNSFNGTDLLYTNMAAFTYNVDSTIYLCKPSYFVDKTIVLKGNNTFNNTTASDFALDCYSYGSAASKPVIYLDDTFALKDGNPVKVMVGAYGVSKTMGFDVFKYSNAAGKDFASMFNLARDQWGACHAVDNAALMANATGNGLLIEEPEAEYTYRYYDPTAGSVDKTQKGSFQEAVTAINNSINPGSIKILADSINLEQTASFSYETKITSDHNVTFTKGFTGGPMFELPSADYKNSVSFTAANGYNITIVGADDGDNPVFSMPTSSTGRKLDLTNVTIQDNTVSGNGGAIRLTNNAGVKLTNVTIQSCSAGGFGGAVYHEDCGNNVGGVYCENVTFKNNQAKGGSAIYVDGVTGMSKGEYKGLTINGCTFTGNSSKNETASTPAEAVKLDNVIYVDCISGSFNQSVAAELKNTNTFTGNMTYSDINLGSNMATMSDLKKSVALTDFSLSTDREGDKLKVVVGSYSANGTYGTYVFYPSSAMTIAQLNTLAENFSLTADKSGNGTVLGNKAILPSDSLNALVVKEPAPQRIRFNLNSNKISNCSIADGTVTYQQDDRRNALSQGSFSMSNVGGPTYAITATPGHTVTFTANLNTGYQVKAVTVTGVSGSTVSVTKVNDTTYTFVMPNEEVTVYATVRTSSSIKVVQPESGSITVTVPDMTMVGDKFTDVEDGTTVTLSATGDDFGKWSIVRNSDSKDITTQLMASNAATSKNTSFKMPPYDITITAKVKHDITVNAAGGTYMVVKSTDTSTAITKAAKGDKIWVDLTPNTNYKLTGVTINKAGGETVSYRTYYNNAFHNDASLLKSGCMVEFYMPDESVTINVTFELDACEITTSAAHGTISGITSPAPIGSKVVFTLTPDTYYELDTLTVKDSANEDVTCTYDSTSDSYSFTMPASNVSINAVFKKKQYTVTTSGGNVTFSVPANKYTWGDTVKFKAEPAEWYSIKQVYTNNSTVTVTPVAGKENAYSFTMPQGDVVITAVTERPNFSVTFASNGGSSVAAKVVANGDAVAKPEVPVWAGRGFAGWYLDEECTQKYDFTQPVTGNLELYARWFLWGDVNNDGVADSYDALLIRRCRVGLTDYSMITNRMAGFVNGFEEGRRYPDSGDAVSIRRYRVGLISRYKVEDSAAGYEYDLENDTYISNN